MRTLTAEQRNVLEGTNRATHARVRIDPGSGFVDMSDLEGRDWLDSVSYGGGTDSPIVKATIKLRRQAYELNLSPLVDGSKLNVGGALVDVGNDIVIDVAVIGQDATPVEADFVEVFRGEIDEIDAAKKSIILQCRDQGHLLVDTFIETQRIYGDGVGIKLETIIQEILDDNINTPALGSVSLFSVNGTGGTPFNVGDSPGFLIREYIQSKESVSAAIRRLAQMAGYDTKYIFHENTSAFQLVLVTPDRRKPAQGTLVFSDQPVGGETFPVNATTITAKAPEVWVAVGAADGADGFLLSSFNGIDWTERVNTSNIRLNAVAYSDTLNLFVAVGEVTGGNPYILTSPDGLTWTVRTPTVAKAVALNAVTFGAGLFVAVGDLDGATDALILTSADGITWTERANPKNFNLRGVTHSTTDGLFCAVGEADGTNSYIITSPDAFTWTERSPAVDKDLDLHAVVNSGGVTVACGEADGSDGYLLSSADGGINWIERANPRNVDINGASFGAGLFVLVGQSNSGTGIADSYVITSSDGTTWAISEVPIDQDLAAIAYNGVDLFTAVGTNTVTASPALILGSDDGINWAQRSSPKAFFLLGVAHSGPLTVGTDEFLIGNTLAATINNIASAITLGTEGPNVFANAQFGNKSVLIEWGVPGTVGDAIVFTAGTLSNAVADGGGTLGGTQAGADGKTIPDFTFDGDHYFTLDKVAIMRRDVRNKIRVTFQDPDDLNNKITIERSDPASIAKFGLRTMEITEESNSQIDTPEEGANFANFALIDLSDADVIQGTNVPYFWPAEDFDLYRFEANGQHYDTDQDLGLRAYKHLLKGKSARTIFQNRGKPAGGVQRWLDIEGNNLRNPAQDLRSDNVATNVTITPTIGGIIVEYDDPRTMSPPILDWRTTEIHVSTDVGYTPNPGTLKAVGRSTRFEITQLIAGTLVFVKIVVVDESGNRSTVSTRQVLVPTTVGPLTQNFDTEFGNIVPNGDFGVTSLPRLEADSPPDHWFAKEVGSSADRAKWGASEEVYFEEVIVLTGGRSIRIDPSLGPALLPAISNSRFLFPVSGDRLYLIEVTQRATDAAGSVFFRLETFGEDRTTRLDLATNIGVIPTGANVWWRGFGVFRFNAAARFALVEVGQDHATAGVTYHDRIRLLRALPGFRVHRATSQVAATGVFTKVDWDSEDHDFGGDFDSITNDEFVCPDDGEYSFAGNVGLGGLAAASTLIVSVFINGAQAFQGPTVINGSGGASTVVGTSVVDSVQLNEGDTVDLRVFHNHGSNLNIIGLTTHTFFTGKEKK